MYHILYMNTKQKIAKVYQEWREIYESVQGTSQSFMDYAVVRGVDVYDAEHYQICQRKPQSKTAQYPYKYQ